MALVEYDISLGLASACGLNAGLTEDQLDAVSPRVYAAIDELEQLSGRPEGFFLDLPDRDTEAEEALARRFREQFTDMVVLGIGGSSLGARAVHRALTLRYTGRFRDGREHDGLRLHFVENVDPVDFDDLLTELDLSTTAFNVITKSGTTIETMSSFFVIRDRLIAQFGHEGYRERVVATTDPNSGALRKLVEEDRLHSLPVPAGVGGRFSVLSAVGTFPLMCAGVDVDDLLRGASIARSSVHKRDLMSNPAALFGAAQFLFVERGCGDVVFMPYVQQLADFSDWFVQLWAESLGKRTADGTSVGPTPMPAIGVRDQHSLLQLFMEGPISRNIVFLEDLNLPTRVEVPEAPTATPELQHLGGRQLDEILRAELKGVSAGLREASRPTSIFRLAGVNEQSLGALILVLEAATAITGSLLGVNPYDQPGVELGKRYAHGLLGREGYDEYRRRMSAWEEKAQRRVSSI